MSRLKTVTPFVLCKDLQAQIAFYADFLDFKLSYLSDRYAYMTNGGVMLRLVMVPERDDGQPLGTGQAFYIDVDDVDALYVQYKPKFKNLKSSRVKPPFDQSYGQREFHVFDEDGTEIWFGSSVNHD